MGVRSMARASAARACRPSGVGGQSRRNAENCAASQAWACSSAAVSPQASSSRRKSSKFRASGWTQSAPPLMGLTANTVRPNPCTKQKWMPSTPAQPMTDAPFGVQK